jgi:hypothetical protein
MRPSFTLEVACRGEDAMEILGARLAANPHGVEGSFSRRHGVLCMPEANQRFWSPCLDLTIEEIAETLQDGSPAVRVWGTFSPRAEIWTAFVFAIGTLAIVAFASLFFGIAQVLSGHPPWAWVVPVLAPVLTAGIYVSALVGQGLAADDMHHMRAYVEACLREAGELARRAPAESCLRRPSP